MNTISRLDDLKDLLASCEKFESSIEEIESFDLMQAAYTAYAMSLIDEFEVEEICNFAFSTQDSYRFNAGFLATKDDVTLTSSDQAYLFVIGTELEND